MTARNPQRAARKLVLTTQRGEFAPSGPITGPDDVVSVMDEYIGDRTYEHFVVLYLNNKNRVIGYDEFTQGAQNQVAIDLSGVIRNALLAGAIGVITVHQHPSGDATPSAEDHHLWKSLNQGLATVGIKGLDHFVISRTDGGAPIYYSLMARGGG
jgi:DNA repair protein RadC